MSNLQIIESLSRMLEEACGIIREQAELLEMHGIATETGSIEQKRTALLEQIEKEGWCP